MHTEYERFVQTEDVALEQFTHVEVVESTRYAEQLETAALAHTVLSVELISEQSTHLASDVEYTNVAHAAYAAFVQVVPLEREQFMHLNVLDLYLKRKE